MNFKNWFENLEAKHSGVKDVILNFLQDKLNINDTDEILSMPIGAIDKNVLNDLMNRGMINTSSDDVVQMIKNGSGTVLDLIDRISGTPSQTMSLSNNE